MGDDAHGDLEELRAQVIRELGSLPDDVPAELVDVDTLMEIARSSSRPYAILKKAFTKAQELPDSRDKATRLVQILKELDSHRDGGKIYREEPAAEPAAHDHEALPTPELPHSEPGSESPIDFSAPDDHADVVEVSHDPQHVPIQYD